jgi:hypothetical protein
MQRSLYTTSPDDDKLQKSKSIDDCLKYFFPEKILYVKKQFENFSGTAFEFYTLETQNFQH